MTEQTVKCLICGEPYVVYPHYAGDQSACQKCRDKARVKTTYSSREKAQEEMRHEIIDAEIKTEIIARAKQTPAV